MKKAVQKSVLLMLASLLVMASGGVSIYHHFCSCLGESTTSVYLEAECSHEQGPTAQTSCCSTGETDSCCEIPVDEQESSCPGDDCCHTSSTYIKVLDNYTLSLEKISFKFIAGFIQVLTGNILLTETRPRFLPDQIIVDPSPPLYGRSMLNSLHQLKISPDNLA